MAIISYSIFIAGILFRWYYLFMLHPLSDYLYSDMKSYADSAFRLFSLGYRPSVIDVFYPPGTAFFFGALLAWFHSWSIVILIQFLFSVSIPILIALIAYELYGKRVALVSLFIASIYFPFIEYAAFLLSENPFTFFFLLAFLFLVKSTKYGIRWALAAGVFFGVASTFRNVLFFPLLFIAAYLLFTRRRQATVGCLAGLLIVFIPLSHWCSRANEGNFCVISTNGVVGVLQGHFGNTGHFYFQDSQRELFYEFGSPTSLQKGMVEKAYFPFGPYESRKVLGTAWDWINHHPVDALALSIAHVGDLFVGTIPWPTSHTSQRPWMAAFQNLYLIFILIPAIYYFIRSKATDLLLVLPMLGLLATVFITIGEPRYRIPFDGLLIILAARFSMHFVENDHVDK